MSTAARKRLIRDFKREWHLLAPRSLIGAQFACSCCHSLGMAASGTNALLSSSLAARAMRQKQQQHVPPASGVAGHAPF